MDKKKKSKKHIIISSVLLVYLIVMAYVTYPGTNNPELSFSRYCVTICITLAVIVGVFFFVKKREENKKKYTD